MGTFQIVSVQDCGLTDYLPFLYYQLQSQRLKHVLSMQCTLESLFKTYRISTIVPRKLFDS